MFVSIGVFYLKFENAVDWILSKFVKVCLVFPKTSKFKELKNKPITKVVVQKFSDPALADFLSKEIKKDPNLKIYSVTSEVLTVLRCLFYDREDIMLSTMDNIVISKMGMEILIVENEEKGNYDRSLFIDLTSYPQAVFQYHFFISIVVGFIVFYTSGNEEIRKAISERFSRF